MSICDVLHDIKFDDPPKNSWNTLIDRQYFFGVAEQI